jgi:hypothetical protein
MMTIEESIIAIMMASVVLDSATRLQRSRPAGRPWSLRAAA